MTYRFEDGSDFLKKIFFDRSSSQLLQGSSLFGVEESDEIFFEVRQLHERDGALIQRKTLDEILHISDDVVESFDFGDFWHLPLLEHRLGEEEDFGNQLGVEIRDFFEDHVEVFLQLRAQLDVVHVREVEEADLNGKRKALTHSYLIQRHLDV